MERTENRKILDLVIVVLLFSISVGIHNYYMTYFAQEVTQVHALIQNATIGSTGAEEIFYLPHMAVSVYQYLLRILFYLVGNKIMAAVVFQAFLKMTGLFVLYFALRMAVGRLGAFISATAILFFPMSYHLLFQINPIFLTTLACSFLLLFLGCLLQGNRKGRFHKFGWFVIFLLYGILCGAVAFMDILGVLIWFVSIIWILCVNRGREREGFQNGILQCVCIFLGSVLSVVGIGCLVSVWFRLPFEAPYQNYIRHLWEVIITNPREYLYAGIVLGGFLLGSIVQVVVNLVKPVREEEGEDAEDEDAEEQLPEILGDVQEQMTDSPENVKVTKDVQEQTTDSPENVKKTRDTELEEMPVKTGPLDNPLPLPKKQERRAMDYVRQPSGKEADFDIRALKEEDDFDI